MTPDVASPALFPAPSVLEPAHAPADARRSWLSALPRLLAGRHVPGMKDAPGWLAVLLGFGVFLAWTGVDRLQAGPDAAFYIYALPAVSWHALVLLSLSAVLAVLSSPRAGLRGVVATVSALALVILGVLAVMVITSPPASLVTVSLLGALVYSVVVVSRTLRSITGRGQPRAMFCGVLFFIAAGWLTDLMYVEPAMWYSAEPEGDYPAYDQYFDRGEGLLFEQPARIDSSVASIAPSDEGSLDVFFLGFAGYGEERVFAEEIKLAARIVAERYGSQERSVLLLNDRRDLDSHPMATPTSLDYALSLLATRMNVDEDILFLALSSHGKEGALAVSHGPLLLQDLTDDALADALRRSGIKRRVIVISACHSGSFMNALRDANTIVITASAADRTSFGCSDERELTYFGEAFYRDALPAAASLREAFYTAAAAIADRERREEIKASKPQAHFGAAVERSLERLVERR